MINTETIERNEKIEKKGNRIIKKAAMFLVALLCCLAATASSSWLTSERVVAVGGVPIIVNKVTQEDINNAKKKRDNAKAEAKKAQDKISSLKDQKQQLTGELSKLNQANAEQKAQYELIYEQLQAALDEKAQALDEYVEFEIRNKQVYYQNKNCGKALDGENLVINFMKGKNQWKTMKN